MSAADDRAAMYAANYGYYGLAALWGDAATPVSVLKSEPDYDLPVGSAVVRVPQILIKLRAIEGVTPSEGDLVVIGSKSYRIDAEPQIDRWEEIWTCEAVRA